MLYEVVRRVNEKVRTPDRRGEKRPRMRPGARPALPRGANAARLPAPRARRQPGDSRCPVANRVRSNEGVAGPAPPGRGRAARHAWALDDGGVRMKSLAIALALAGLLGGCAHALPKTRPTPTSARMPPSSKAAPGGVSAEVVGGIGLP